MIYPGVLLPDARTASVCAPDASCCDENFPVIVFCPLSFTVKFLIKNFTVNDNGENTMTVKFSSAQLASGAHTVAVRAVGNKTQGYFKSPLPDADTATVMVTI